MHSYPANEKRISEVERGRICNLVLPMPRATTLFPGDFITFALANSHAGKEPCYVKCGDSVRVLLTEITDLGSIDPATGQALYRLSWTPLGQSDSPTKIVKRFVKSRSSHGRSQPGTLLDPPEQPERPVVIDVCCPILVTSRPVWALSSILPPASVLIYQKALMFPKYRHTPIFDAERKRCPVCHRAVYSLSGIHPQCAIKQAMALESRSKREAASNAGPESAVVAVRTDAAFREEARRVIVNSR